MKRTLKRLFAILTICAMTLGGTATVFAAETSETKTERTTATEEITPRASAIVGFNSANFSGSYGEVYVYVDETLWGANFSCAVSGNSSATYDCYVELPNKEIKHLGWVNGNGVGTDKDNLWIAFADLGYYRFYCKGTGGSNMTIMGTVYD